MCTFFLQLFQQENSEFCILNKLLIPFGNVVISSAITYSFDIYR